MGTSASVPIDIEAFRPPPGLPVQLDGYCSVADGVPATITSVAASPGLATGTDEASASSAAATTAARCGGGGGGGGGENNGGHHQEAAEGRGPFEPAGASLTTGCGSARTNPVATGKRPRVATAMSDDRNIGSSTGQEGEPPRKRSAGGTQVEGRVGVATPGLPAPGALEPPGVNVGTSPGPSTPEARPDATGTYTAALDAINGDPATATAGNGALAAPVGFVTTPAAVSMELPQPETAVGAHAPPLQPPGTPEAVAVAPPQPSLANGGEHPRPLFLDMLPLEKAVGSEGSDRSATLPPAPLPPAPVWSSVPLPPRAVVAGAVTCDIPHLANGRFHQEPPPIQQSHAVPTPAATAAFGVGPPAAPAGSVASHAGAGEGLASVAAAGGPSAAAPPRHYPPSFVLPLPAEPAGGGVGTASGGGGNGGGRSGPAPRRRTNRKSGPAAAAAAAAGKQQRQERRKCAKEGCKRRPTFGAEGTRQAQFCASHKPEGFVNVLCKRCSVEGCKHQPSFGTPGAKPVRCATHRLAGMVNLSAARCASPGCRVVPSFARPGARKGRACAAHRGAGDVDVVTRRCHHEGCVRRPVFGDISAGKALYCSAHKLDGMMNIFAARCTAMGCMELATFGVPDIKRPTHCTAHRDKLQHGRITNYHS